MKNLISMTDFVLKQNYNDPNEYGVNYQKIYNYANFLKKPLELWIFMDKERCLFENHDLDIETIKHHIKLGRTVEYFATFKTLKLTATALKQLGL